MNRMLQNLLLVAAALLLIGVGVAKSGVLDDVSIGGSDDDPSAKVDTIIDERVEEEAKTATAEQPQTASGTTPATEPAGEPEPVEPAESEPAKTVSPYAAGGLPAISKQLVEELGYSPKVLQIIVSDDYASFQVQDPKKPANVDEYAWRDGKFEAPEPVRLSGATALAPQLFRLTDVNLAALPALRVRALKIPIEGPEVSTTIIKSGLPFTDGVLFYMNVSGTRDNKQLRANAKGRFTEVV